MKGAVSPMQWGKTDSIAEWTSTPAHSAARRRASAALRRTHRWWCALNGKSPSARFPTRLTCPRAHSRPGRHSPLRLAARTSEHASWTHVGVSNEMRARSYTRSASWATAWRSWVWLSGTSSHTKTVLVAGSKREARVPLHGSQLKLAGGPCPVRRCALRIASTRKTSVGLSSTSLRSLLSHSPCLSLIPEECWCRGNWCSHYLWR